MPEAQSRYVVGVAVRGQDPGQAGWTHSRLPEAGLQFADAEAAVHEKARPIATLDEVGAAGLT
jgi:hypothetical protein